MEGPFLRGSLLIHIYTSQGQERPNRATGLTMGCAGRAGQRGRRHAFFSSAVALAHISDTFCSSWAKERSHTGTRGEGQWLAKGWVGGGDPPT